MACPEHTVTYMKSCLDECPSKFYNDSMVCQPCNSLCQECTNTGPDTCMRCEAAAVLGTDGLCAIDCRIYEYMSKKSVNGTFFENECVKISELLVLTSHLYLVGTASLVCCTLMLVASTSPSALL